MKKITIISIIIIMFCSFFTGISTAFADTVCCHVWNSQRRNPTHSYKWGNVSCESLEHGNTVAEIVSDNMCDSSTKPSDGSYLISGGSKTVDTNQHMSYDCSNEGIQRTMKIFGTIILWIRIVAPVIIVITGGIALAKAVLSQDETDIRKCIGGLLKKIAICAIIIFLPLIIFAILKIVDDYNPESSNLNCIECLNNPGDC